MDENAKPFRRVTERLADARTHLGAREAAQVATVEQQVSAISRGDFEAALRQASPDVELEIYAPPEFPFICRARGAADLQEALRHNFGALDDQQPLISNVVAQGDVVVMFGTERGTIRATGAPYHVEFVHRFTFVHGALTNIRIIAARTP